MGMFDKAAQYVRLKVKEHRVAMRELAIERQRQIDENPEIVDPVTIDDPQIYDIENVILWDIDVELISIVRSLRANGAEEIADILKMLFPMVVWSHRVWKVSQFETDFFELVVNRRQETTLDLWEYIWLRKGGWANKEFYRDLYLKKWRDLQDILFKLDQGEDRDRVERFMDRYNRASYILDKSDKYTETFDECISGANTVLPWNMLESSRPDAQFKRRYDSIYRRKLLGVAIAKLLLVSRNIMNEYGQENFKDVLTEAQYASLVKSMSIDRIDINLAASIMNKFSDEVLRKDLLVYDSFSTAFLNDLIKLLDSITDVFADVVSFATKQREVNRKHDLDMARAKTLDYLNENIKPLDSYRSGFHAEGMITRKELRKGKKRSLND